MKKQLAIFLLLISFLFATPVMAESVTPSANTTETAATAATPEQLLQQWYQLGDQLRKAGNYPFTELSKGDTGYEVTVLQTQLAQLGYYQKKVVDNFGSGTLNALRAFEKANGLTVDGVASVEDQKLLFSGNAKSKPSTISVSTSSGKTSGGKQSDATSGATSK